MSELPLFENICGRCTNKECLDAKNKAYLLNACDELTSDSSVGFYKSEHQGLDEDITSLLNEKGVDIYSSYPKSFPEEPECPNEKDFDDKTEFDIAFAGYQEELEEYNADMNGIYQKINEGSVRKIIVISNNKPEVRWLEKAAGEMPIDPVTDLENKDKRNNAIAIENIIKDCKELVATSEIPISGFTDFEQGLLYFVMLDKLTTKHYRHFDINPENRSYLTLEEKYIIYMNLTEDQKTIIMRDFLFENLKNSAGIDKQSLLFTELVKLHFPSQYAGIDKKYIEIYQKRHDKIIEKIRELTNPKVEDLPEDMDDLPE